MEKKDVLSVYEICPSVNTAGTARSFKLQKKTPLETG